MDIYLPNEFYALRDELPDWRDPSPCEPECKTERRDDNVDPNWQAI